MSNLRGYLLLIVSCCCFSCSSFLYQDDIMRMEPLHVFRIASQPTAPADRKDSLQYQHGFEVLQVMTVSALQDNALKAAFAHQENYSASNTKRCLFTPAYVLQQDSNFSILLALSPCGKVMFVKNGKDSMMDLVNSNSIETVIGEIAAQKK